MLAQMIYLKTISLIPVSSDELVVAFHAPEPRFNQYQIVDETKVAI